MSPASTTGHARTWRTRGVLPHTVHVDERQVARGKEEARVGRSGETVQGCLDQCAVATALSRRGASGDAAPRRSGAVTMSVGSCSHGALSPCWSFALPEFQDVNLALIRPTFRVFTQSFADRILAHVLPFLSVAFTGTQEVIEESFLPVRFVVSLTKVVVCRELT